MSEILHCKQCGGNLKLNENATLGTCIFCGSVNVLPRRLDSKIINLYNRANSLRQKNEFERAMNDYEEILKIDNEDSEAHWGMVLCRYGVEYVEDPNTRERKITLRRAQYESVYNDVDYLDAIKYADPDAVQVFQHDADIIEQINTSILEYSSSSDQQYDIFLCYKESDAQGNRTEDSLIAYDIYSELTKRGYNVFFSRVTLNGLLGTEYEAVIFSAINTSKAMIMVTTSAENANSIWVRNEWSRYRELIKKGEKVSFSLIPVYKNIKPSDLPLEFERLQGLDASQIGYMQDLCEGIKKIIRAAKTVNRYDIDELLELNEALKKKVEDSKLGDEKEVETKSFNKKAKLNESQTLEEKAAAMSAISAASANIVSDKIIETNNLKSNDLDLVRGEIYEAKRQLKKYESGRIETINVQYDNMVSKARKNIKRIAKGNVRTVVSLVFTALFVLIFALIQPIRKMPVFSRWYINIFVFFVLIKYLIYPIFYNEKMHLQKEMKKCQAFKTQSMLSLMDDINARFDTVLKDKGVSGLTYYDFECKIVNNGTRAVITKYVGDKVEVIIPREWMGIPITEIAPSAFENCYYLRKVTIGNNIGIIGNRCFANCTELKSVKIDILSPLTRIPDEMFLNCSNLTSYSASKNINYIGNRAFKNCTSVLNIILSDKVSYIGDQAMANCPNLNNIKIVSPMPPQLGITPFDCDNIKLAIYVEKHVLKNYLNNPNWRLYIANLRVGYGI